MATKKNTENESNVAYRTPAAVLAAARGEETFIVNIRPRHSADTVRVMEVDNNPKARIPTDEDVEVAANEYVAIRNCAAARKARLQKMKNLEKKLAESGV